MTKTSGWCYLYYEDDLGNEQRVRTFLIRESDAIESAKQRNWKVKQIVWD